MRPKQAAALSEATRCQAGQARATCTIHIDALELCRQPTWEEDPACVGFFVSSADTRPQPWFALQHKSPLQPPADGGTYTYYITRIVW